MCAEIRSVQRRLGITTVYVTHNQAEAMMVSDRIGVMRDGRLLQVGTPEEVYVHPRDEFVAAFFGKANVLRGEAAGGKLRIAQRTLAVSAPLAPGVAALLIRPEAVAFAQSGENLFEGNILHASFLGGHVEYEVRIEVLDTTLRVQTLSSEPLRSGRASLRLPPERLVPLGRAD
jgi:iron(III) transport system ATP-binding protein